MSNNQEPEIQGMELNRASVLVSSAINAGVNTEPFATGLLDWVVRGVALYLAYQFFGLQSVVLFVATPILVKLIYEFFVFVDYFDNECGGDDEDDYDE